MRRVLLPALAVVIAGMACARRGSATTPSSTDLQTLVSGGQERTYLLHVPPNVDAAPRALILSLHGYTATAAEQEKLDGLSSLADEKGFIVVYPQGLGNPPGWRVGPLEGGDDDLNFLSDLIDDLGSRYPIDPRRIYATGISNGGGMVDRLGCRMADRIAAIAPVSGAYLFSGDCQPARPMPVLAFHGTGDDIVPYEGEGRALPPIRDWAAAWAQRDGCAAGPTILLEQGAATVEGWSDCQGDSEVQLVTITDGGHWWPGADFTGAIHRPTDDIEASAMIWAFFENHPLHED